MLDFLNGSISNFMQIEYILYVWAGCEYIYIYNCNIMPTPKLSISGSTITHFYDIFCPWIFF